MTSIIIIGKGKPYHLIDILLGVGFGIIIGGVLGMLP